MYKVARCTVTGRQKVYRALSRVFERTCWKPGWGSRDREGPGHHVLGFQRMGSREPSEEMKKQTRVCAAQSYLAAMWKMDWSRERPGAAGHCAKWHAK